MPFGCPALDALDDVIALRSEAEMAVRRIARRDQQARVLPPGSRDDLALALDLLRRAQIILEADARPTISRMYRLKTGH